MSKRFIFGCAIVFAPFLALTALTESVRRDVDKDMVDAKVSQSARLVSIQENNKQIFQNIMDSRKGDTIDYFKGKELEIENIKEIKRQIAEQKSQQQPPTKQ
ncbi:hypothetical protein CYY_005553 [Polysphondylium violaceum]|uniref:Uncharacterized protein n=1 Tax=Polysphondylium violaceum TaxID=133409 RepID=A0A8J4PTG4_9MYCE|nr:hypothetical protein CYY_005553 [Polysphondylium violaceum]